VSDSDDYGAMTASVTVRDGYGFILSTESGGTEGAVRLNPQTYALTTYDGANAGGFPHLLANMNNVDLINRIAVTQGTLYADVTTDQSINTTLTTIDLDVRLTNDALYDVSGNTIEFLVRGYFRVMADVKLDGPGFIVFGALQSEVGSLQGNMTGVILAEAGETLEYKARGDGGSRTLRASFTRIQIEYIGAA